MAGGEGGSPPAPPLSRLPADYVYFENSSSNPYLVRRIEELNKTANGNVEAKVVCLFRRRDISSSLNSLADSNAREKPSWQIRARSGLAASTRRRSRTG
uniref:Uncharacterized protein n=1 Tax=Apteryx owenii TaxID=8824 RepID=A0A8B9PI95_APTOW